MNPIQALNAAAGILDRRGVVASQYEGYNGRCCFIGALSIAQYGNSHQHFIVRRDKAYEYVIQACESLLPGWDHSLVTAEVWRTRDRNRLPEAVLARAIEERAGKEIAGIVMTRAIKLAEAEKAITDGRVADEAEMVAHGTVRHEMYPYEIMNLDTGEITRV